MDSKIKYAYVLLAEAARGGANTNVLIGSCCLYLENESDPALLTIPAALRAHSGPAVFKMALALLKALQPAAVCDDAARVAAAGELLVLSQVASDEFERAAGVLVGAADLRVEATLRAAFALGAKAMKFLPADIRTCIGIMSAAAQDMERLSQHVDACAAVMKRIQTPRPAYVALGSLLDEIKLSKSTEIIRAWMLLAESAGRHAPRVVTFADEVVDKQLHLDLPDHPMGSATPPAEDVADANGTPSRQLVPPHPSADCFGLN